MLRPMYVVSVRKWVPAYVNDTVYEWVPIVVTPDQDRAIGYRDQYGPAEASITRVEMI